MSQFVTADEHYGHGPWKGDDRKGGIIRLANRPFATVKDMRECIIARHNEIVPDRADSLTWHVGDMFWSSMEPAECVTILQRLHGKHAFLYGNHDELIQKTPFVRDLFTLVVGYNKAGGAYVIETGNRLITLNHFALRVWQGSHKGHGHVYGHSHNALPGLGRSFDIGVDGNNFYPWTLDGIVRRMETLEPHHTIDNTGRTSVDVVKESI